MKLTFLIFIVVTLISLLAACAPTESFDNEKFFPQKVGEYTRSFPPQRLGDVYTSKYNKPDVEIFYYFGSFKTDQRAQTQFDNKKRCDFPDLPDGITPEVIKEAVLKDKTGKEAGKIRVCRETVSQLYTVVGDYKYSITLINGNNFVSAAPLKGGLADLIQFTEALPFNSDIDFGSDFKELIAANSSTGMWAHDLMKLDPPVMLAKEPYVKGKFLIVRETPMTKSATADDRPVASFVTPLEYDIPADQIAGSYEEAGSVVRISCLKGAKMADYISKNELKQKFPAYSVNCRLSVIDKTIPAIIAQKDIIGTDILDEVSLSAKEKEVRALAPIEQIKAFMKQLQRR